MTNAEITKALGDARRLLQEVTGVALHAPTAVDLTAIDHVVAQLERAIREGFDPIPMVLWCPACGRQHIDMVHASDPGWTNPPHRSHKCASCSHVWRPADVATTGVPIEELQTRGAADAQPPMMFRVQCAKLSSFANHPPGLEDRIVEHLQASPLTAGRVMDRLRVLGLWTERLHRGEHRGGVDSEWYRADLRTGDQVVELYSFRGHWSGMYHASDRDPCNEIGPKGGFRDLRDGQLALDAYAERHGWSLGRGSPG